MEATIVYFSQTGNTRRVAEALAQGLRAGGHAARLVSLRKATAEDAAAGDLLGIGTPCFSSQAPTPVKRFLSSLPGLERKRAFVFATCGGAPGRVLYDQTRLLQSKGAEVVGGFLARGTVYHPAPCLRGRYPHRPGAEDLAQAERFAAAVGEHVAAGRPGPLAESRPEAFKPGGRFYNLVALLSTDGFLRRALPEPKADPARCDQCRWCVAACPMHNISLQPTPRLGGECIRCYRCVTGCPQQAFTADWRLGNLAVWAFYNEAFERWFGDVQPGERVY